MKDSEMINEVEDKIADADVAALYGVETRRVFELKMNELRGLMSKISTSKVSTNNRKSTKVFTERGLYMLATILSGDRAREVTSLELNFIIGKLKHSVKRVRK